MPYEEMTINYVYALYQYIFGSFKINVKSINLQRAICQKDMKRGDGKSVNPLSPYLRDVIYERSLNAAIHKALKLKERIEDVSMSGPSWE